MNCGGFHGYGNCPYYDDQSWENRPDLCWEGDEDFNQWNPPYHQYYGDHDYQPFEQEESHQSQRSSGKKSIEEMLESFLVQQDNIDKKRDAAMRNLETQIQELSRLFEESNQVSPLRERKSLVLRSKTKSFKLK